MRSAVALAIDFVFNAAAMQECRKYSQGLAGSLAGIFHAVEYPALKTDQGRRNGSEVTVPTDDSR